MKKSKLKNIIPFITASKNPDGSLTTTESDYMVDSSGTLIFKEDMSAPLIEINTIFRMFVQMLAQQQQERGELEEALALLGEGTRCERCMRTFPEYVCENEKGGG